jgi:hypothetical protein
MEKTIDILLAEQRDAIYTAIIDTTAPEPMTWIHKLVFEQAKIIFARIALQTRIQSSSIAE